MYVQAIDISLKFQMYIKCANYSTCINGERMPIYKPYINLVSIMMRPEVVYTDDNNNTAKVHTLHLVNQQKLSNERV